jgi:peptidoglycan/LPS O-acetylase OafA/YrhL
VTAVGVPAPFGRRHSVPSRPRQFPSLDGYRALAAVAVLTTHVGFQTAHSVNGALGGAVARLEIGVTLFFLLSGFLLYRPYSRAAMQGTPTQALVPYLWRRVLRVLPAYWVAVIAALLLVRGNEDARTDLSVWIEQLLLLQIYVEGAFVPGLTQMWSLCVEVAFYLTLPLLAAVATKRHRGDARASARSQLSVLLTMALSAWSWQLWVRSGRGPNPELASLWLPGFLDWFALGMAFAVAHSYLHLVPPGSWSRYGRVLVDVARAPWACWSAAGGLYLLAITPLGGPRSLETPAPGEGLFRHVLYGAIAALVMLPGLLESRRGPGRLLASPAFRWIGLVSYGVFLYHLVVLDLVFVSQNREFFTGGFWQVLLPTLGITLLVAGVSWYLLESPLLRLKSRGPGRQRAAHAVSAGPGTPQHTARPR